MNGQIISYTPQGAVPPSEAAGLQFSLDMAIDAINYHENGDETDPACCTGDAPCQTRIYLVGRQRDLAKKIQTARTSSFGGQVEETTPHTSGSGQASSRTVVADPASEAQIRYVKSLIEARDTSKIGTFPTRTMNEIQAGHEVSKSRASSLITALKNARISAPQIQADPATPAQIRLIETMATEQGREVPSDLDKKAASDLITEMMKIRETRTSEPQIRTAHKSTGVTEDGMYRTPAGDIYKVQVAVHGSGRLYAKKLVKLDEPKVGKSFIRTHDFEMEKGAIYRLTADMKMTLAEAQEFGKLYGTCCRCGKTLTKEKSIDAGIGPVCAGKF